VGRRRPKIEVQAVTESESPFECRCVYPDKCFCPSDEQAKANAEPRRKSLFSPLRIAYADPPYPGQSKRHYGDHPDYAGEVDHAALVERLRSEFPDGWALSTSSTALREVWNLCPEARCAAWTKPFAAFKNQRITFAWEPVLYVARGGAAENVGSFVRDWVAAMPPVFIGQRTGVPGTKPTEFCFWLFDLLGLRETDEFHDLFPGSGSVLAAWEQWRRQPRIQGEAA
jgi:hypothetical protein